MKAKLKDQNTITTKPDATQETTILWELIQQHWVQGRHLDTQRTNMSRLALAISAGVLGLIAYTGLESTALPLTFFLIFMGVYGGIFSAKYDNQFYVHMQYARIYRKKLDKIFPALSFEEAIKERSQLYGEPSPVRKKASFKLFWLLFHFSIAFFGIILSLIIIFHPGKEQTALSKVNSKQPAKETITIPSLKSQKSPIQGIQNQQINEKDREK